MPLTKLQSSTIIQRIIDILKASSDPDLQLKTAGGPIAEYIYGEPDLNEYNGQYPVIYVMAGTPGGGNFYDAADAISNTSQLGHFFTATIGIVERASSSELVEKNALDRHDDVRLALRKDPALVGIGSALVQKIADYWASAIQDVPQENSQDFVIQIVLVPRWVLLEDTIA